MIFWQSFNKQWSVYSCMSKTSLTDGAPSIIVDIMLSSCVDAISWVALAQDAMLTGGRKVKTQKQSKMIVQKGFSKVYFQLIKLSY